MHRPGRELLAWALDVAQVAPIDALQELRNKLEAMPWDLFQTQMLPAIESATAFRYTADTWVEMKDRVAGTLAPLLETYALELLEAKP